MSRLDPPAGRRPAPVVSRSGPWDVIPDPFDEFNAAAGLRDFALAAASLLLAVVLTAWLSAFSLAQATTPEAALPAITRAAIVLTGVDALLDVHAENLEEQALAGGLIDVPGYPLNVSVPAAEATGNDGAFDLRLLREALVDRSALLLREEGLAAFRDPGGAITPPSRFSSAGLLDQLITRLRASEHDRWSSFVTPLGYAAVVLAAAVMLLGVGFGRLIRLGGAALIAGALVLIGAVLIRFMFGVLADDGAIGNEARSIMNTLASGPIRNGLLMAIGGAAILLPALALGRLFESSDRRAARRAANLDR